MNLPTLSGRKNRKEKEAAGGAAAQTLKAGRAEGGGGAGVPGHRGRLRTTAPGFSLV